MLTKRLTALQKEDIKEDVRKSANTVQTKAFYVGSTNDSAFEHKQILADSVITYSNAILHEEQ